MIRPREVEARAARSFIVSHATHLSSPPNNELTIPSFVTVAEKFADEFWTSATTPNTVITTLWLTPLDFHPQLAAAVIAIAR
jgi:hypothetical protein